MPKKRVTDYFSSPEHNKRMEASAVLAGKRLERIALSEEEGEGPFPAFSEAMGYIVAFTAFYDTLGLNVSGASFLRDMAGKLEKSKTDRK